MTSYTFAFITIFLVFAGGGTILGSLLAAGLSSPGTVTWNYIMQNILSQAALTGLFAGLFGCVLLVWFGKDKDELMNDDRGEVLYDERDELKRE